MDTVFKAWEARYPNDELLRDGILDNARWDKTNRKLLFILKEYFQYHDDVQGNHHHSIRNWVEGGARGNAFFKNTLAMSLAVHYPYKEAPESDEEWTLARECLLSSAIINIKKVKGKSQSTDADISRFANDNGDLLKEQIQKINPDIVICGGTFKQVAVIIELTPFNGEEFIRVGAEKPSCFFIGAYHPSYWKEDFYQFHGYIQEAINKITAVTD